MQPQLSTLQGSFEFTQSWSVKCPLEKKFNPTEGLGVIQTVRDDITANWPGARHWPLEPRRTGGELDYREWHLWAAGHGGWPSRQTQRGGRIDRWGCDGRDYRLFRRGGLAIFRGGRTLPVRAHGVRAADGNSGRLDAVSVADGGSGGECEFVCDLSGGILAGGERTLAAFCDPDITGRTAGAH